MDYRHYFPPNFEADFLRGREAYFWGGYHWAFFTHVVSGPASLLLGMLLISERLRGNLPVWHRRMGRLQGICVLLLVAPSGLWMAWYAQSGTVAAAGLGLLAVATAAFVALGWKAAVARRFAEHQRWMMRTFLLLWLGGGDSPDRRPGDSHGSRRRLGLSAGVLDKLARAAGGIRIPAMVRLAQPGAAPRPRTVRNCR
jgi:hypothetical protein